MKRAPFFLIFAILITACAAPTSVPPTATLTPMTPIATLEPSPTATPPAPTEGAATATAEPTLPPTPEPLLPPDFTVANWQDRAKILPYCYVRADLSSSLEGLTKLRKEVEGLEFYKNLRERKRKGEIYTIGTAVLSGTEGDCAIISIWRDMSNESGAYFQSRLNPNEWIEVKFTDFQ